MKLDPLIDQLVSLQLLSRFSEADQVFIGVKLGHVFPSLSAGPFLWITNSREEM